MIGLSCGTGSSCHQQIYRALGTPTPRAWWLRPPSDDARAAKENVHRHYDLGGDFYRLWLDREMVYTCAYFPTPNAALEYAQIAKMVFLCRKPHLRPGERVIEAELVGHHECIMGVLDSYPEKFDPSCVNAYCHG